MAGRDASKMQSDQEMDAQMGSILRAGVVTACLVMIAGAVLYLLRHGGERESYTAFHGEPAALTKASPG